jgi:hypothetical protein
MCRGQVASANLIAKRFISGCVPQVSARDKERVKTSRDIVAGSDNNRVHVEQCGVEDKGLGLELPL